MENTFPSQVITLPSKGYYYPEDSPLASGEIDILYPTAKHEDILTSRNLIQKGIVLDKFMQAIIVSEFDYNDLLLGDKNGIMVAARILAYGKDYEVKVNCPQCNEVVTDVIDLVELEAKEIEFNENEKAQQEFEFELPISKKKITLKLLTHRDQNKIDKELKNLKKFIKQDGINKEITTRLMHTIVEIEGNRENSTIRDFVKDELFSQDSLAIREKMGDITPDMDTTYQFCCDSCGHEEVISIPMGVGFFWPTSRV